MYSRKQTEQADHGCKNGNETKSNLANAERFSRHPEQNHECHRPHYCRRAEKLLSEPLNKAEVALVHSGSNEPGELLHSAIFSFNSGWCSIKYSTVRGIGSGTTAATDALFNIGLLG